MRTDYTFSDIEHAYRQIDLENAEAVLIEGDLACLGFYEFHETNAVCAAHFDAMRNVVGDEGTIVVLTPTKSIVEKKGVFDPLTTPSEWGILSEYVRTRAGTVRSMHPTDSFAANGPSATAICGNVSRHVYGPRTPIGNLLDMDTRFVSIGLSPHVTPVLVHHIEFIMGVPYRYVREFTIPVRRNGKTQDEQFYRHVWYYMCNIKKDINKKKKLFDVFTQEHEVESAPLGRGKVFSYRLKELYECTLDVMMNDPYFLLAEPPVVRPYRESM